MKRSRWLIALLAIFALVAAACGDDDDDTTSGDDGAAASDDGSGDDGAAEPSDDGAAEPSDDGGDGGILELSGVCPNPMIIQTDWFPEPEHGWTYQAAGVEGDFDANNGIYTGTLVGTDLTLEVRAGGPYIDFNTQTGQFYTDPDIFMAYVNTDEAIQSAGTAPVVAVLNYFEIGPQVLMWDDELYDFETFAEIGEAGAPVLYFGGAAYMEYLVATGEISEDQIDGSYDGSPTRFIAEGDLVQQGFATNEPWRYENELGFDKPVEFLLIHEAVPLYQGALSVKPESLTEDRECLEAVVPIMQQSIVDYMNEPEPVNEMLLQHVIDLNSFWTATSESHAAGTQAMIDFGLVTDGDNGYVGDMDAARIQGMIDQLTPVYESIGIDVVDGLAPEDIFTNEFLDPSISLGY